MSWKATVLTLFPSMFPGPLGASLIGQAREKGIWSLDVRDIREHGIGRIARSTMRLPAAGRAWSCGWMWPRLLSMQHAQASPTGPRFIFLPAESRSRRPRSAR